MQCLFLCIQHQLGGLRGAHSPIHCPPGKDIDYEANVPANVKNVAFIAQDEIFGPFLCVIPAEDEEHPFRLRITHRLRTTNPLENDPERSGTVGYNASHSDNGVGFGGATNPVAAGREARTDENVSAAQAPSHLHVY